MSKIQPTWRNVLPAALTAALCGVGAVSEAQATLMLSYSANDGINSVSVVCVDNAACDTDATVGSIILANGTTPIPGLTVNGSDSFSVKSLGPGGSNILSSGSTTVTYNGAGAFVHVSASLSDTFFVGPSFTVVTSGSGTFLTTGANSNISLSWWNDPANHQGANNPTDRPGNEVDSFAFTPVIKQTDSFAHTTAGVLANPDGLAYSMTLGFDFNLDKGASLVSRGQTEIKPTAVPEPGTLLLAGLALSCLGVARRRTR